MAEQCALIAQGKKIDAPTMTRSLWHWMDGEQGLVHRAVEGPSNAAIYMPAYRYQRDGKKILAADRRRYKKINQIYLDFRAGKLTADEAMAKTDRLFAVLLERSEASLLELKDGTAWLLDDTGHVIPRKDGSR